MQGALYDLGMAPFQRMGLRQFRGRLVRHAAGNVLEIGVGTGLNFEHYEAASHVTGLDPDLSLLEKAKERIAGFLPAERARFEVIEGDAQALPFGDESFDTVVATLVLCTVPDPEKSLREAKRVLKTGGRLMLIEHVRMPSRAASALQDLLTPMWKHIAGGCHLNRDPEPTIRELGFTIEREETRLKGLARTWVLRK